MSQPLEMMEDSPCLYISVYEDDDDEEEEEEEEEEEVAEMDCSDQEEVTVETDMRQSPCPELCENQDSNSDWDSLLCRRCGSCFTSPQELERHVQDPTLPCHHTHEADDDGGNMHPQEPQTHPTAADSPSSSPGHNGRGPESPMRPAARDPDLEGGHACDFCDEVFSLHINKRRHERRFHRRRPPVEHADQTSSDGGTSRHEPQPGGADPTGGPEAAGRHGDASETLGLYVDGELRSTDACEAAEAGPGPLMLDPDPDPDRAGQAPRSEATGGPDAACPSPAKRRAAMPPPLLPQIKTEREAEAVVSSSSSSSLVSSLMDNLLPQSRHPAAAHRERTIFLSPKLKRLLDEQDGLKPTLALITDGQKFSSPLSVSVVPAGSMRYRRRTASPSKRAEPGSTSKVEETIPDVGDADPIGPDQHRSEARHASPPPTLEGKDDAALPLEEMEASCVAEESWPPRTGGNPCNQQPLDLSNAVRKGEEDALAEAALDLSLQRQSLDDPPSVSNSVPLSKKRKPNSCLLEKAMLNPCTKPADTEEQNITLGNPEAPLVTNFTIVTGSRPGEPLSESVVYGLTLPPVSLNPPHTSLLPVALQQSSPCTISLSSAVHAVLPSAPNLITVLASAASIASPSSQALQVLAPTLAPEPLVVCTEESLNAPGCEFNSPFANAAGLLTLSQPFDPALSLPGHVFLADPIGLGTPVADAATGAVVPFSPAMALNESLLGSYRLPGNTVLIECTLALEAPGSVVPAAINLEETVSAVPAVPQLITSQVVEQQQQQQQQQGASLTSAHTADPAALASPSTESAPPSDASPVAPDSPAAGGSNPEPEPALTQDEDGPLDRSGGADSVETPPAKTPPPADPAEAEESADPQPRDTPPPQTFTKNFACNVCEKLFHSMKELGQHVGDHADAWPYKCEFCVLLVDKPAALLEHRLALHGVGTAYLCSVCSKEFVYLSNLKHHQEELHPGRHCSYTEEEKGKLRPQNHNCSTKVDAASTPPASSPSEESGTPVKKEEGEEAGAEEPPAPSAVADVAGSDDGDRKGLDVRLGINQHYPSFKPPPFPYHNRSPAGSMASATNFTTHNIPQSFSTAIRCTKCGKSFDNLPELHRHILACATASDKRRYTPKKNPIPLRHFAKAQNGVLSTTNASNGLNASHRPGQAGHRSKQSQESPVKMKLTALGKRKKRLVQRAASQRNKPPAASGKPAPARSEQEAFVCPHCSREFTMRRSRTKHMAVCPKKPKEAKKRKDTGVSLTLTKENNGHLLRGRAAAGPLEEKRQPPPPVDQKVHGGRVYVSSPAAAAAAANNRPAILPVQAVLTHKRSKIIIKESVRPPSQEDALSDLPIGRTFSASLRQYGRAQPGARDRVKTPLVITVARPHARPEGPTPPPPSLLPPRGPGGATGAEVADQTAAAASADNEPANRTDL